MSLTDCADAGGEDARTTNRAVTMLWIRTVFLFLLLDDNRGGAYDPGRDRHPLDRSGASVFHIAAIGFPVVRRAIGDHGRVADCEGDVGTAPRRVEDGAGEHDPIAGRW